MEKRLRGVSYIPSYDKIAHTGRGGGFAPKPFELARADVSTEGLHKILGADDVYFKYIYIYTFVRCLARGVMYRAYLIVFHKVDR